MSTAFDIRFEITEQEWSKAFRRRHDPDAEPIFDVFYGNVVIDIDGKSLLGPPYNISVADLACGMATILQNGFPSRASQATFRQGDDSLEIDFSVDGNQVLVSSEGQTLRVDKQTFVHGARSFVRQFAREVWKRVPDAVGWKDLKVLGAFAGPGGSGQTVN